jgi:putative PEP-CTERM system histidine kinase
LNSFMSYWLMMPAFLASAAALGLFTILVIKKGASPFHRSVAAALGAAGLIQLGNGLGWGDAAHALEWRRFGFVFELLFPAALQYVGLVFLKSSTGEERGARWRAGAVSSLALAFAILAFSGPIYVQAIMEDGRSALTLGPLGRVAYVFIVLSLTMGLAQLEHVLRVTRDPLRYQIKFVLIGLGGLAGYGIYQASQLLMVPVWNPDFVLVGALATLISLGLMAFGFGRLRLREVRVKVYVSPQLLYGSVTFLVIGLYLLSVGLVGEVIRHTGQPLSSGLSILVVFVSILALVIVLFSRAAHATVRQFIARHFYRSKYDYRAKWLEVMEAFGLCASSEEVLDRLIELLGRTFGASRLSIWIRCEADGQYHQVRSLNTESAPRPLEETHPLIAKLMESDNPVEIDKLRVSDEETPTVYSDSHADTSEAWLATHVLCVPIRSEPELIGFITLNRQFQGAEYGQDDFDLLRAIAHHAGMLLALAKMAEDKSAASELEALHRFSAFCLHDLKNLAAKLSLVMQNAQLHGQEPAFQQAAMRTVAGTVEQMMALITKLSLKSRPPGVAEAVDVPRLIAETVGSMNGGLRVAVNSTCDQPAAVRIVKDQLQQVVLNLILNTQQEMQGKRTHHEESDICIDTEQSNGSVIITISDRGPGISEERIQTLFQPFKSTKSNGLGLGLYQCKRIIEEHGGSIRIRSEAGRGTQVRIELPAATSS